MAEEIHKPVRHHFERRRVMVRYIDHTWAADLVEMQQYAEENDGYRYILTVIDVFSKYAWVRPLNTKTGVEVAEALSDIMSSSGRKATHIWCDKGKEFYNRNVQKLVNLYITHSEMKSCIVERFNRTLKQKMYKYFTANNTWHYIDVLQDLINQYNYSKVSSIKMTPVLSSNKENEAKVYMTLYGDIIHAPFSKNCRNFKLMTVLGLEN